MLPRRKRLSAVDMRSAMRGRRLHSPNFSIIVPPSPLTGCAVVVPAKVAHTSVERHRIKRRTLAALRRVGLPPALVVFPRLSVGTLPFLELVGELQSLVSRIGV